jgi:hypothetical protein
MDVANAASGALYLRRMSITIYTNIAIAILKMAMRKKLEMINIEVLSA